MLFRSPLSLEDRKRIRLALWAESVQERMSLVDRVWRSITERVHSSTSHTGPELIQVVRYGNWVYPLYVDGDVTRVIPYGGMPLGEVSTEMIFEIGLEETTV